MTTPREEALARLCEWSRPGRRAALLAAAWTAGEQRVKILSEAANVRRQTVYTDLASAGIDIGDRSSDRNAHIGPIAIDGYTGVESPPVDDTVCPLDVNERIARWRREHGGREVWTDDERAAFTADLVADSRAAAVADWHNGLVEPASAEARARLVAHRALQRFELAWAALETAKAWQAAHHKFVLAYDAAAEAVDLWLSLAESLYTAAGRDRAGHRAGSPLISAENRAIYEAAVPSEQRIVPDVETPKAALAELRGSYVTRRRLAAATLGALTRAGVVEEQPEPETCVCCTYDWGNRDGHGLVGSGNGLRQVCRCGAEWLGSRCERQLEEAERAGRGAAVA
jgi:hypothetical protein